MNLTFYHLEIWEFGWVFGMGVNLGGERECVV